MSFPPLAALFLTHFDDIKGQTVIFYETADVDALPATDIEHKTLPSGLHTLSSDSIFTTHHGLPCAGLFRSKEREDGAGRGRAMGTLGVVLAPPCTVDSLFDVREPLGELYDKLQALPSSTFSTDPKSPPKDLLRATWSTFQSKSLGMQRLDPRLSMNSVRDLVNGKAASSHLHPLSYLPSLLEVLGPSIIPVQKAALAGKRILLYSPPPLLPLGAFGWCIWAMSLPPAAATVASISTWLGHVGLMDLDEVKTMSSGWIATTSDSIYRNHPSAYDVFIDISQRSAEQVDDEDLEPTIEPPTASTRLQDTGTASVFTSTPGHTEPKQVSYTFSDLPLYRSLMILSSSPSSVTIGQKLSKSGGLWLVAFEILERVWRLCVGVCEFAVGRGRVGVQLDGQDGESARLLEDPLYGEYDESPPELIDFAEAPTARTSGPSTSRNVQRQLIPDANDEEDDLEVNVGEDEGIRRGRLILRQLHHHSYHLYRRLKAVRKSDGGGSLIETELRELCGVTRWTLWGGDPRLTDEGKWWSALARQWGVAGTSNT